MTIIKRTGDEPKLPEKPTPGYLLRRSLSEFPDVNFSDHG